MFTALLNLMHHKVVVVYGLGVYLIDYSIVLFCFESHFCPISKWFSYNDKAN